LYSGKKIIGSNLAADGRYENDEKLITSFGLLLPNPVNIRTYRSFAGIFWKVQTGRMVPRAGLEPARA
jgi:hypothetical protein